MEISKSKQNLIMTVMIIGAFISSLSQSLLTSALPIIMKEFEVTAVVAQWLTTIYILVLGIITSTTAYLINRFNTKYLFIGALTIFLFGCTLSVFSLNFYTLLASRVIQACGAGVLLPQIQVVALQLYPKERHGYAMGLVGLVISLAPAVGPTLSGILVDSFGWKSIFYALICISSVIIISAIFILIDVGEKLRGKLDLPSAIIYGLGFCCLMIGVTNYSKYEFNLTRTIIPILIGFICLSIFVLRQLKIKDPLLKFQIFKDRDFSISFVLILISYLTMMSGTILVPLYTQSARGISATISGLVLFPGALVKGFINPIAGTILDKFGARLITIIGMIFMATGTAAFIFFTGKTSLVLVSMMYAVRMSGVSMIQMPLIAYGVRKLKKEEFAHGTAIISSIRQMFGALGSTILVAIVTMNSTNNIDVHGINVSFMVQTILIGSGLIYAFIFIKNKPLEKDKTSA